jgi:hypothetical protein
VLAQARDGVDLVELRVEAREAALRELGARGLTSVRFHDDATDDPHARTPADPPAATARRS